MNEPIKSGDRCEVVSGMGRHKSPNIGLTVTVESLQGEHSQHGRIWRCRGAGLKQLTSACTYIECGWADFPASWLRKLPPEAAPLAATTTDRELQI